MKNKLRNTQQIITNELLNSRNAFRNSSQLANYYTKQLVVVAFTNEVLFIDDNDSESVEHTYDTIQKINHPISLIIGGLNGLQNYSLLNGGMNEKLTNIITFGVGASVLVQKLKQLNINIHEAHNLKNAVNISFAIADKQTVILFSPASMPVEFKNSDERKFLFEKYVKKLNC